MTSGTSAKDGDKADGTPEAREIAMERSASVDVSFAPHTTTVMEFTLEKPGVPTDQRADLGIGGDDVKVVGRSVEVTVHSLGAIPATGGTASLIDASGKMLASTSVPTLAPPADLLPKTAVVKLSIPAGASSDGLSVRLDLPNGTPEVTRMNNLVALPAPTKK
jgi:hypothetical protein